MKLVSSFMDDLLIVEGACHTITFQSSQLQANFRQLLNNYFSNRNLEEWNYIMFLDAQGNQIMGRDFYFVPFDCREIYLKEERDTSKQIKEILIHYLENNPDLLNDFIQFKNILESYFSNIELSNDHVTIDFQLTDKTISQVINSLDIQIEYKENDFVPNHVLRDFLIRSLIDMNILGKPVILLISYPESNIGTNDFIHAMDLLKQLNITTFIITSHPTILTSVKEENIFLVHENGTIYDIIALREELISLDFVNSKNSSKIAKVLAYRDFEQDYFLLSKNMKKFILSNRI